MFLFGFNLQTVHLPKMISPLFIAVNIIFIRGNHLYLCKEYIKNLAAHIVCANYRLKAAMVNHNADCLPELFKTISQYYHNN